MLFFKSYRKSVLQFFLICLAMFVFVTSLAWFGAFHPTPIKNTNAIIAQNTACFMIFRGLLIIGIFLSWPAWMHRLGVRRHWSNAYIRYWEHQRFKITLWLVLFELVLCDNLLLKLMHLLGF